MINSKIKKKLSKNLYIKAIVIFIILFIIRLGIICSLINRIQINAGSQLSYYFITGAIESFALTILILSIILTYKLRITKYDLRISDEDRVGKIKKANIILVFFITFFITGFYSIFNIEFYHDGVTFNPALDILNGKTLYKDTFNQYGALTIYLQSLAMLIFGKYLIVTKLLAAFFYGLIEVVLYLIWRRIMSEGLALLSCIISLLLLPYYYITGWVLLAWSSVYALFFQVLALYFILKYYEQATSNSQQATGSFKEYTFLFLCGASAALCYWCKQNTGMYDFTGCMIAIPMMLSIIKKKCEERRTKRVMLKRLLQVYTSFLFGFVLCSSIFIIHFVLSNSLNDWYKQTFGFGSIWVQSLLTRYGTTDKWTILPIISESIKGGLHGYLGRTSDYIIFVISSLLLIYRFVNNSLLWRLIPIISIVVLINCLINIKVKSKKLKDENGNQSKNYNLISSHEYLLVILIIILPSWLQYFPLNDIHHAWWAVAPMTGIVVYFLKDFAIKLKVKNKKLEIAIFTVLVFMVFIYDISSRLIDGSGRLTKTIKNGYILKNQNVMKYMIVDKNEAEFLNNFEDDLDNYLKQAKGNREQATGNNYNAVVNLSEYIIFSSLIDKRLDFHPLYEYQLMEDGNLYNLYTDYRKDLNDFVFKYHPLIINSSRYSGQGENDIIRNRQLIFNQGNNMIRYKEVINYEDKISNKYLNIMIPEN